jgi:hypothetical protein
VKLTPTESDFKKAMGSIVLTAGAILADADRMQARTGASRGVKEKRELGLAREFCRLLLEPIDKHGPRFADIPGFPEAYCRKHLSRATDFLRHAVATRDSDSAEVRRLIHVGGLIEKSLQQHLGESMAICCWFGDRVRDSDQ